MYDGERRRLPANRYGGKGSLLPWQEEAGGGKALVIGVQFSHFKVILLQTIIYW